MAEKPHKPALFEHGSAWIRADFHLHTNADKEFTYSSDENYYLSNYIGGLDKAGIRVGLIANHNKFNFDEFKALRKTAKRQDIFLIPGVELSVNDGANGIHTLVAFSDEWLEGGQDYISPFITSMFPGKTAAQYANGNFRSDKNILQVVAELDKVARDYFLVFAHVEESKGLWKEMDGGKLGDWKDDRYKAVRDKTLGFQKVRTGDLKTKVQQWLGLWYPAEVEGSDCKSVDEIGKGIASFLKIGSFTFEAVKYALADHLNRAAMEPQRHERSYIVKATFEGGVLGSQTVHFASELNTLIGIRGSGKSSILEALRYALDIPFGEKAEDLGYKNDLPGHMLGSGGKITVQAVDRRGEPYEIRRILNDKPEVYINDVPQPGISIRETIVHKPIYFGQKDLSSTGKGFEKDLVEKILGEKLAGIRVRIDAQRQKVSESISQLSKLAQTSEKKSEYEAKKQDAVFRLEQYKKHGVEAKLEKQVDFDVDARKCQQVVDQTKSYLADLADFISRYEDDLKNQSVYHSKQNESFFTEFFSIYAKLITSFEDIKSAHQNSRTILEEIRAKAREFENLKDGLKEEFAEIERKLAAELKESGVKAIKPDEFRQLRRTVDQATQMIAALDKQEEQRKALNKALLQELAKLNDLWHEEFKTIQAELNKVNERHAALAIRAEYKGNKEAFVTFMKDIFRGSRIRETTFEVLAKKFSDFVDMFKSFDEAKSVAGATAQNFELYFGNNLPALLTWQVPNRFVITYRGKELKHHSLGQRASALILFVLSQQENDVIIIDQPEDDLDNQTIYEDVIKLIRSLKPKTQFIFATHNANIPVLGDAEQILACTYSDDKISLESGGIDNPIMQNKVVTIMEGGEEAFKMRKRIYDIWKPQSF